MLKSGLLLKIYKRLPALAFDLISIPLAWYFAYWLRYNMQPFPNTLVSTYSLEALFILMTAQVGCYYYFKVYRGLWNFSSINDLLRIIKAGLSATIIAIPALYLSSLLSHVPRSVLPLYCLNLVTLLGGARLAMRMFRDQQLNKISRAI